MDASFYKRHCIYLPAMAGWFLCSASLSAYNKVIFGANHASFPCPLFLTSIHFLVQWLFSYCASTFYSSYFGGEVVANMSWRAYLGVSIPCGLVTALDVGFSNMALVRISITFFTMVKSSSPIWVLTSAFMFGLEKITCNLILVGALITTGEILTAFGEVEFDTVGFLLCLTAAVLSGVRWTLMQFKLQKVDPPLRGPVVTMRVISSTMFFSMVLLSFIIEQPWIKLGPESGTSYFADFNDGLKTISLGLVGAFIAIAMVLCEFWLILKSNAIVLMIGGVLKEMITIFVGVFFFGDELNIINISGIIVVFMGVFLYKATLYFSRIDKETISDGAENESDFSRVTASDVYEDEPLSHTDENAYGSAPSFTIDDDDDDDDDSNYSARFELDGREEEENLRGIT